MPVLLLYKSEDEEKKKKSVRMKKIMNKNKNNKFLDKKVRLASSDKYRSS